MEQEKNVEGKLNQFFQVQKSWQDKRSNQNKTKTETLLHSGKKENG